MRRRLFSRHAAMWVVAALVAAGVWTVPNSGSAGAATGALIGEGGDALGPVMQKLLRDDTTGLAPDTATYTRTSISTRGSPTSSAPRPTPSATDFAVTERQLTPAEAATAKANGRSFAYVPFAATPVALVTLVPNSQPGHGTTINRRSFCQHIPLTSTSWTASTGLARRPGIRAGVTVARRCTAPPHACGRDCRSFARAISTRPWRTTT